MPPATPPILSHAYCTHYSVNVTHCVRVTLLLWKELPPGGAILPLSPLFTALMGINLHVNGGFICIDDKDGS